MSRALKFIPRYKSGHACADNGDPARYRCRVETCRQTVIGLGTGPIRFRQQIIEQHGISPEQENSARSEEHTSELQSLMRISYAVFCLKKKKKNTQTHTYQPNHKHTK